MPDFIRHWCRFFIFLILLFNSCQPATPTIEGKVVGISDGDTIKILWKSRTLKIRLYGIDCPERKQAFGTRAKEFTASLCAGETVEVISYGEDRYGRILGEVILPDGRSLNQELVLNGYAWYFYKYANDPHLHALEKEARAEKRGLWKDPNPVPPWDFRKSR